jgi:hypothetical protein
MGGHQVSLPLNPETSAQKEERLAEESYREKTMRPFVAVVNQSGRAVRGPNKSDIIVPSVNSELDRLVRVKVADQKANAPDNYYQDGMLDEEEAFKVAYSKFRSELQNDDAYMGSLAGEIEHGQEMAAFASDPDYRRSR